MWGGSRRKRWQQWKEFRRKKCKGGSESRFCKGRKSDSCTSRRTKVVREKDVIDVEEGKESLCLKEGRFQWGRRTWNLNARRWRKSGKEGTKGEKRDYIRKRSNRNRLYKYKCIKFFFWDYRCLWRNYVNVTFDQGIEKENKVLVRICFNRCEWQIQRTMTVNDQRFSKCLKIIRFTIMLTLRINK